MGYSGHHHLPQACTPLTPADPCLERRKPIAERRWVVVDRNCNYSAFNGYRWQWSSYSLVRCLACGKTWRTKAAYVGRLRDGTLDE